MAAFGRGHLSWGIFPKVRFFRRNCCSADAGIDLLRPTAYLMGGGAQVRTVLRAAVNLTLCYWANRIKQARPFLTPPFSFPHPHCSRPHPPCFSCGTGEVLSEDLLEADVHVSRPGYRWASSRSNLPMRCFLRFYLAATAPSHVVIGGGVAGNAGLAAVFATMGIVAWWTLRRHAWAESGTTKN